MKAMLLQFGGSSVATVHPSGVVDIRVNSDQEHRTMTDRMTIGEFARIARIVFMSVHLDTSNDQEIADIAVFDTNLIDVGKSDPKKILNAKVLYTIAGGDVVYER